MAMALAPLALVCETLTLLHPEVVNKSYPGFWKDLEHAGFQLQWMQE
jgi:3-phosphoshikimate 1-carboxyvinyltransferase